MAFETIAGYGWVLAALLANIFVTQGMAFAVGAARRRFNVQCPTMYASEKEGHKDAKAFNCVQRAHQNTLEFLPSMVAALLLGGLQYPLVAAALGALYAVARIQYFRGYSSGVANNRFAAGGVLIFPAYYGLVICTVCLTLHQYFPDVV